VNFLSSLHDASDNVIRVLLQDFFPVLCPATASGLINLEEADRIVRAKLLYQYIKPLPAGSGAMVWRSSDQ
jgi:hypothetical protein